MVEKVENIGAHYARALGLWKTSFLKNFDAQIRPALRTEHPDMTDEAVAVFRRKWEVRLSIRGQGPTKLTRMCPVLFRVL